MEQSIVDLKKLTGEIEELTTVLVGYFAAAYFVLDSNVWMDERADVLFNELMLVAQQTGKQLCLFRSQTKEVEKLKKL